MSSNHAVSRLPEYNHHTSLPPILTSILSNFSSLVISTINIMPDQSPHRTLRQVLREILKCCSISSNPHTPKPEIGILRRGELGQPYLPDVSLVSLLPNFEASRFNIDKYSADTESDHLSVPGAAARNLPERRCLLPASSISQLNLHDAYATPSPTPSRRVQQLAVPSNLRKGASQYGQIASLPGSNPWRSPKSTLRIPRSGQTGSLTSLSTIAEREELLGSSSLVSTVVPRTPRERSIESLTSPTGAIHFEEHFSERAPSRHSSIGDSAFVQSVKHFGSFCVLDSALPGCPVTATSEDLRYIFEIGEQFFLNIKTGAESSIDIVTGCNSQGDEVTHLVLFSPLTSPSTGHSRFLLAALIDVTDFVTEAAQFPNIPKAQKGNGPGDQRMTRSDRVPEMVTPPRKAELLTDDLLGGCSSTGKSSLRTTLGASEPITPESSQSTTPIRRQSIDIWLTLAEEEFATTRTSSSKSSSTSLSSKATPCSTPEKHSVTPSAASQGSSVDGVLDEFMSSLKHLYSDFFLLARSALDDKYYELCNVSPSIYVRGDYVTGHLSHTSPEDVGRLSSRLGEGKCFSQGVRWGDKGMEKQLYCIPLYGQRSVTWICMLVDDNVPTLW